MYNPISRALNKDCDIFCSENNFYKTEMCDNIDCCEVTCSYINKATECREVLQTFTTYIPNPTIYDTKGSITINIVINTTKDIYEYKVLYSSFFDNGETEDFIDYLITYIKETDIDTFINKISALDKKNRII